MLHLSLHKTVTGAVAVALLALAAFAAEDVRPSADVTQTATTCDGTPTAWSTLDDDPDSPGADWCEPDTTCEGSGAQSWTIRVGFATPSGNPAGGADQQTFAWWSREGCTSDGTDPTITVDYYCSSSLIEAGVVKTLNDANAGMLHTDVYTHGGGCAADGSDVEAHIVCTASGGNPGARRSCGIESIEWRATVIVSGSRNRAVVVSANEVTCISGPCPTIESAGH